MMTIDKTTTVAEIMTERVIVVRPNETMDVVQDIFRKNNIHHVPVVDKGMVVGMVSHADYLKLLHGFTLFKTKKSDEYNDAILRSLLVKEVMTKQVATLGPEDSLELAAGFFRENLFHALPVVDEENMLIGIVTTYDLLNYAYG
ncbi:MAG: CBS domain-containing protein [Saprospiraceae bacterium]|jgi:CBS domain-containing protein|nr:CBS domain-containing protein [Saprospiraceae bacterium]HRD81919.1 CBS domain-containing protein [Saprospiraceae bacterium]HRF37826.1 CBS domain-containing protein [Saprospiraceae bacterium]HRJ14030.1 CBS domain-containing protein [Saprospiraceae bacterium]HRK82714.1 CBS domain-containing protein [Saprospiraceae bacterium]